MVSPPDWAVVPTTSVAAVIADRSADCTLKVPPAEPTVIDLEPLGCRVTVPEPALIVPEKATSLAVIVIGAFVEVIDLEAALVTLPVPSAVIVTPVVPETLWLSVTEPLEPDEVCNATELPDTVRGLKTVILPLAVNVTVPLVDVTLPMMLRSADAPVVATEKLPPTDEVIMPTAPALLIYATPGLPVLAEIL